MTDLTPEQVAEIVGSPLSEDQAKTLIEWYTALARGVMAFPSDDLRGAEPPLRSTPAPR